MPARATNSSGRGGDLPQRRCTSCRNWYRPDSQHQDECWPCKVARREAWREVRESWKRREDALHRRLLAAQPQTLDAIYALPSLADWKPRQIRDALDGLIAAGKLEETAHGRLIVRERVG